MYAREIQDGHAGIAMDLKKGMEAGDPLLQQALTAMRRYNEARDSITTADEVERLRLEANSLMEAVQEYQRCALVGPPHPLK